MFKIITLMTLLASTAFSGEVTVSGKCEKNVKPDRVSLVFTAENVSPTAVQAQRKSTDIYEAVKTEVKKMNFKDQELQTESTYVNEEVDWSNNKKTVKGYRSSISLKFITSEIDRAGNVIPVVLKAGAQGLGQLQMYVSDATYDKAYLDCLSGALSSAKDKATKLLKGHSSGNLQLLEVSEGQSAQASPIMYKAARMEMAAASDGPSLETKTQKIEVSVTAKFKF